MSEEEKNALIVQTRNTLLELSKEELSRLQLRINISTGTMIGTFASAIVLVFMNPEYIPVASVTAGVFSSIANIIFRLKRNAIYKKADSVSKEIVSKISDLSELVDAALPFILGGNIAFGGVSFSEEENEEVIETSCEVLDENGNSLMDRCNLLIEYAYSVSYPGFEDDVADVQNIINELQSINRTKDGYEISRLIYEVEDNMYKQAYYHYTGDFPR